MHRIDNSTAAASLPTPAAAGTAGYFSNGNPGTGVPATIVDQDWMNDVQEEMAGIPLAAGMSLDKTNHAQILTALKAMFSPVVGTMRGAKMSVTAASATATFIADEIIVETALGGQTFRLANFSQSVNLATTGAGGMDTGSAPVSGYVALYAIYNPASATQALLAVNATSSVQPSVYGGTHMPSGYTASALISVWPTNGSGLFAPGLQLDRSVNIVNPTVLTTGTVQASPTSLSIATAVPLNARSVSGNLEASTTVSSSTGMSVYPMASPTIGAQGFVLSTGFGGSLGFRNMPLTVAQTLYYTAGSGGGTPTFTITLAGYDI